MRKVSALIVAAGEGRRFGFSKQFAPLRGKPVLDWSIEAFGNHERVDEIVLVLPAEESRQKYHRLFPKILAVVKGGARRQDSVLSGFRELQPDDAGLVLIHDGVRPLVRSDLISRVIEAASEKGAAVPALPIEETVKEIAGMEIIATLAREKMWRVQTPQGFSYSVLQRALDRAAREKFYGTDEAMLVERLGEKVYVVEGDPRNIKITTPLDLKIAEVLSEL